MVGEALHSGSNTLFQPTRPELVSGVIVGGGGMSETLHSGSNTVFQPAAARADAELVSLSGGAIGGANPNPSLTSQGVAVGWGHTGAPDVRNIPSIGVGNLHTTPDAQSISMGVGNLTTLPDSGLRSQVVAVGWGHTAPAAAAHGDMTGDGLHGCTTPFTPFYP